MVRDAPSRDSCRHLDNTRVSSLSACKPLLSVSLGLLLKSVHRSSLSTTVLFSRLLLSKLAIMENRMVKL